VGAVAAARAGSTCAVSRAHRILEDASWRARQIIAGRLSCTPDAHLAKTGARRARRPRRPGQASARFNVLSNRVGNRIVALLRGTLSAVVGDGLGYDAARSRLRLDDPACSSRLRAREARECRPRYSAITYCMSRSACIRTAKRRGPDPPRVRPGQGADAAAERGVSCFVSNEARLDCFVARLLAMTGLMSH